MSREHGTRRRCSSLQSRQRLVDAHQFLEAAHLVEAPDVVATNAIHAAIAAADSIACHALGERSSDGNHASAVELLRRVDPRLASTLKRALSYKTQAAYDDVDVSAGVAASCLKWASQIVAAADALDQR